MGPFPLLGVAAGSGVRFRIGVQARSRVRERFEVRGTRDLPHLVLTDLVLFFLTPAERFPDGSLMDTVGRSLAKRTHDAHHVNLYLFENYRVSLICSVLN